MDRAATLGLVRERTKPWDMVVIGGGATGVGCAVDAASRGLDVLLVEQHDLGKGTSSRSTKLIHGGVRYLRQGSISLVREALREQALLLANAPHVVREQAFVIPCYSRLQRWWYLAGIKLYDLLAGKQKVSRSRMLSRDETIARLPTVRTDGLAGGVLYYDGQFDDARLLIDLAVTAVSKGAAVLNYARVTGFRNGSDGRVAGVMFEDVETGEEFHAETRAVINATGAFCDGVRRLSDAASKPIITYSQGVHLAFDGALLGGEAAMMIPTTTDDRVLFCIPWNGSTLVGTTDTPVTWPQLEPTALDAEIDLILKNAGMYLSPAPRREDILSVFAGIRPLVKKEAAARTSSLSREHTIEVGPTGMLTITGGKWTTYRRMAEDSVDAAIELTGSPAGPSETDRLAIASSFLEHTGSPRCLDPDMLYCEEDVVHAVRHQMARTVEDVLARRMRVLFLNAAATVEMAPAVAEVLAREMGKDEQWKTEQVTALREVARGYSVDTTSSP